MRIFAPEPTIGDLDGFKPEVDIFGRASLGAGLSRLVTSVQEPMVIALDADWGTGKSVFLKMWAGELRNRGVPVIYFDAFANDFSDDAFLALASEIINLAKEKKVASEPKIKTFAEKATGAGKVLLRSSAKILVKGATLGVLNADDAEGIAKDLSKAVADETSTIADKSLEALLQGADERKITLQAFREALSALPSLLAEPSQITGDPEPSRKMPLVIIIDELDRCTPPFALNLLERIKHVFSVQNVQFVFGVHLEQLCNSVRATYGQQIDARAYLQKFIHITVPLVDTANNQNQSVAYKYMKHLSMHLAFPSHQGRTVQLIEEFLIEYALRKSMSLRSIERIYTTVALAFSVMNERTITIAPLMVGLAILKLDHPDLYRKAKQGRLEYIEIEGIFEFNRITDHTGEQHRIEWQSGWWRCATDPNAPDALVERYTSDLMRYGLSSRFGLLPLVANSILDSFVAR
jgi:KAP family P-loop domain